MNEKEQIMNALSKLDEMSDLYSKITESIFDKEILFKKDSHKIFANFVRNLIKRVIEKGQFRDFYNISMTLMKFNSRVKSHRFTAKQIDDYDKINNLKLQNRKIIDYYQEIDDIMKIDPSKVDNIDDIIKKSNELWETDPLPENWQENLEELNKTEPSLIKAKENIRNLLSKLGHVYESFVLFSTFLLILFRKIHNHSSETLEKDFSIGRKLNINRLYNIDLKKSHKQLLNDYISTDYPKIPILIEIFTWVFGKESIREFRNIAIHHQDESCKCVIKYDHILVYFESKPKKYTYLEILNMFRQLQFFLYLILYINMDMFYRMNSSYLRNIIDKSECNNDNTDEHLE